MNDVMFKHGKFEFIELPANAGVLTLEGQQMQHCLADGHTANEYARRIANGSQRIFSMVEADSKLPVVDIELAVTESSYSGPVTVPTITQIRGIRNECPPHASTLEAIKTFFETIGPNWQIGSHGVRNFDGRVDGDLFIAALKKFRTRGTAPVAGVKCELVGPTYSLAVKPFFRNQELVSVDLSRLLGDTGKVETGRIVGKSWSHIMDIWLVDFGHEFSSVYPWQVVAVPHTAILRASPPDKTAGCGKELSCE